MVGSKENSMDIQNIVAELKGEISRISQAIGLLEGLTNGAPRRVGRPPGSAATNGGPRRKGGITPAGRRKLAEAMKARWAQRKATSPAPTASAKATSATKPKKRGMSAAGRKRVSEAMKKRWAEKKRKA
jgi:hypothetical protein